MECPKGYCEVCFENGFARKATFGFMHEQRRCSQHKEESMKCTIQRFCPDCLEEGVRRIAHFGYYESRKRIKCSQHREENMVNLSALPPSCTICLKEGTIKEAQFGYPSSRKRERCDEHKTPKMIKICFKRKRDPSDTPISSVTCPSCLELGITRVATHGYPNERKTFCSKHKKEGMVGPKSLCKACLEEGVYKEAHYGYPEKRKRLSCSGHKEAGMVDLSNKVAYCIDCKEEGILKKAYYGKLFGERIHCYNHRLPDEDAVRYPRCDSCSLHALFGNPLDGVPRRCRDHQLPGDFDLVSRICIRCGIKYTSPNEQITCSKCSS